MSNMDSPQALLLQSINLIQGYNLKSETSESLLDDLRESLEKLEECTPDTELPQELTEVIKLNLHCIYESLDSMFKCIYNTNKVSSSLKQ